MRVHQFEGEQIVVAEVPEIDPVRIVARPEFTETAPIAAVWSGLRRMVTLLYLSCPGDFIVLHLITSLFAMEAIAEMVGEAEQRFLQHQFWSGAWAILAAEQKIPSVEKYGDLLKLYRERLDSDSESEWGLICRRAYLEAEEHNPKLVYVLLNWWRQNHLTMFRHAAAQFTATPDLPESFEAPPQID